MGEIQPIKPALVAELTWAKLYTKAMHKGFSGVISAAISKSHPITAGTEMKKSAEKLHDQLQTANRTGRRTQRACGVRPRPIKNHQTVKASDRFVKKSL